MRTYNNINFTFFQLFEYLFLFFGRTKTIDIIYVGRKILEAFFEGIVVLKREDGCWHKYCGLFTICYSLERSANSNFCFSETYIAAHQSIHGRWSFHVALHIGSGFALIGGVFVEKRRLQFCLQITIGRKRKAFRCFPFSIKLYQIGGYIFYLFLCFAL